jgi:hypothetical protein
VGAYILEVVEEVSDRFALRIGEDILVVDFRAAWEGEKVSVYVDKYARRQWVRSAGLTNLHNS